MWRVVLNTRAASFGRDRNISPAYGAQVLVYGRVIRPTIGITLAPPQAVRQLGQEGVLVLEVLPGSPAYKVRHIRSRLRRTEPAAR